jgi:Ca2+-binding RTX toxin-like protein
MFNPQNGEYTYLTSAQDKSQTNNVVIKPGWSSGSTTCTVIEYEWWKVGHAFIDSNIEKYCFGASGYVQCPAKRVVVRTGLGDDTVVGTSTLTVPLTIEGGAGSDKLQGGRGPDEIWGACPYAYCPGHSDVLNGGVSDDVLHGGDKTAAFAALDTLYGSAGNDRLDGGTGGDHLYGGADTDLADYSRHKTPVVAWLDDKSNDGSFGENDYIHADVEGIQGSNSAQETPSMATRRRTSSGAARGTTTCADSAAPTT